MLLSTRRSAERGRSALSRAADGAGQGRPGGRHHAVDRRREGDRRSSRSRPARNVAASRIHVAQGLDSVMYHGVRRLTMAGPLHHIGRREGGGKSTHARVCRISSRAAGRRVVLTREPGGTPEGEAIRSLLVTGDQRRWSPQRRPCSTMQRSIAFAQDDPPGPRLRRRSSFATASWIRPASIKALSAASTWGSLTALEMPMVGADRPRPHLDPRRASEIGLARAHARSGGEDRFERKGLAFHRGLRDGFLAIAPVSRSAAASSIPAGTMKTVAAGFWRHVAAAGGSLA